MQSVVGFTGSGGGGGAGSDQHRIGLRRAEAAVGARRHRHGDGPPAPQARHVCRARGCSWSRSRTSASAAARATPPTSTRCRPTARPNCTNGRRSWSPRWSTTRSCTDVNSDQQQKGLETDLVIDRATASRLGVSMTPDRQHAVRRVRPAPGLHHLQRAEPVPRGHGGGAALLAKPGDAARHLRQHLRRQCQRHADVQRRGRHRRRHRRTPATTAATIASSSARNAGGADVDVAQSLRALPVLRRHLHHHVVLVERAVDGGDLALAERVVERVVDLRRLTPRRAAVARSIDQSVSRPFCCWSELTSARTGSCSAAPSASLGTHS